MQRLTRIFVCLAAASASPLMATTATHTTVSVPSTARPGETIVAEVKVTGDHIYYDGYGTKPGGAVQLYSGGEPIAGVNASGLNTVHRKTKNAYCGPRCSKVKIGDPTTIRVPILIPDKPGDSLSLKGRYTGDEDARSSWSSEAHVKILSRDVSAVVKIILD